MMYQSFNLQNIIVVIMCSLLLSGCMTTNRAMPDRVNDFSPVMPQTNITEKVIDGSIYSGGMNDGLFGDRKAYRVGDLITILLRESTAAEKSADNNISRSSSNDALSPLQLSKFASPCVPQFVHRVLGNFSKNRHI